MVAVSEASGGSGEAPRLPRRAILHVEDDVDLAGLVKMAFESFGFAGEFLNAYTMRGALALLGERATAREHVDIMLVDVELPDGSGLDFVREVKHDPVWRLTPAIMLSSETDEAVVAHAYALGANAYVPKGGGRHGPLASMRSLYEHWMESALLPRTQSATPDWLGRAVTQRARSSELCMRMASAMAREPEQMQFWLDLALSESNLSNLLVFLKREGKLVLPGTIIENVNRLQERRESLLLRGERSVGTPRAADPAEAARLVIDILAPLDVSLVHDVLPHARQEDAVLVAALRAHTAAQLTRLASYVLRYAAEPDLHERAQLALQMARAAGSPSQQSP